MFLTRDELTDLTGYARRTFVLAWLRSKGYRFEIGGDGWPRVLRSSVLARLGETTDDEPRLNLA